VRSEESRMGNGALEEKVALIEERLAFLEKENRLLRKAKDVHEIQNVMSLHEYYHSSFRHEEELDAIWAQEADDVSFEEALAILGGLANVGLKGTIAGNALKRLGIVGAAEAAKLSELFGVEFDGANLVGSLSRVFEATPSGSPSPRRSYGRFIRCRRRASRTSFSGSRR